jgi:hypothetical protein
MTEGRIRHTGLRVCNSDGTVADLTRSVAGSFLALDLDVERLLDEKPVGVGTPSWSRSGDVPSS